MLKKMGVDFVEDGVGGVVARMVVGVVARLVVRMGVRLLVMVGVRMDEGGGMGELK